MTEATVDQFPALMVPCGGCGMEWPMPGRWMEVLDKLLPQCDAARLFFRCRQCASVSYAPTALDLMTGYLDFFQVILDPLTSKELFQMLTYDIGGWGQMVRGGLDSPVETLKEPGQPVRETVPGEDLTVGLCAPKGALPYENVKECLRAVRRQFP